LIVSRSTGVGEKCGHRTFHEFLPALPQVVLDLLAAVAAEGDHVLPEAAVAGPAAEAEADRSFDLTRILTTI